MDASSTGRAKFLSRTLATVCFYSAFVNLTGVVVVGLIDGVLPVLVESSVFLALFVVVGYVCLRQNRRGYLAAGIVSLASFMLLQQSPLASLGAILQNPGGQTPFVLFLPYYVAMFIGVPYGLYGFYSSARTRVPPRQIQRSSILAFVALGVVIGGLLVGLVAANTESSLLASSGSQNDIKIVRGSASASNPNFYLPANFTAKVGQTVTWVNQDSNPHTVTSSTGAFDSGAIAAGASYSYTFTQAGVYQYSCTYHSWMKGTIIVSSG